MPAKLFCATGELRGSTHVIENEATIGRGQDNTVVVPQKLVSQAHARIFLDSASNRFILEDLNSRNGTHLDGLAVRHPEPLSSLCVVTLAERYDFIFQIVAVGQAEKTGTHPALELGSSSPPSFRSNDGGTQLPTTNPGGQPVRPPLFPGRTASPTAANTVIPSINLGGPPPGIPRLSAPRLVCQVRRGSADLHSFPLAAGRHVIGRSGECNIQIDDPELEARHAAIVIDDNQITLEVLTEGARVVVAGKPVDGARPLELGDVVSLGSGTTASVMRNHA